MVMSKVKKPIVLPLATRRMFILMEYVMQSDRYKVDSETDFLNSIGFNPANLWNLKNGVNKGKPTSFTLSQITAAYKIYGVDANWFVDETHIEMLRKDKPVDIISALTSTVLMAIDELKNGQKLSKM